VRSIGFDNRGDEHLIPLLDDSRLHRPDPICGCNPDPYQDEQYHGEALPPARWWWSHHPLGFGQAIEPGDDWHHRGCVDCGEVYKWPNTRADEPTWCVHVNRILWGDTPQDGWAPCVPVEVLRSE